MTAALRLVDKSQSRRRRKKPHHSHSGQPSQLLSIVVATQVVIVVRYRKYMGVGVCLKMGFVAIFYSKSKNDI